MSAFSPETSSPSSPNRLTQTWALFVDAYRELNARKLFWVTLLLSALVAAIFAMVGIDEQGITFLQWHIPSGPWNSASISPAKFYKFVFSAFAIPLWLAWAAMILAVISTASIFPDFLSSGAVDLYLSRPLSRLRLFLTKYLLGLLFVALQVTAFSAACFMVIGIRGHSWEPALFLSIPLVTLTFSFLFSISVLFGSLTRSTIAAIMLTMLVWLIIFGISVGELRLYGLRETSQQQVTRAERMVVRWDKLIAAVPNNADFKLQRQATLDGIEREKDNLETLNKFYRIFYVAKFALPKTGETVDLLRRSLVKYAELPGADFDPDTASAPNSPQDDLTPPTTAPSSNDWQSRRRERIQRERATDAATKRLVDSRSIAYTLGTSLAFEAVLLTLTAFIFSRKDY